MEGEEGGGTRGVDLSRSEEGDTEEEVVEFSCEGGAAPHLQSFSHLQPHHLHRAGAQQGK